MSDNLELTAAITTEEPEVAAALDELRFLVFKGKQGDSAYDVAVQLGFEGTDAEWLASLKGEQGEPGKAKSAYLDYDVVRLIEDDSIYTSATMWSDIDNGVVPLIYYISAENVHVYFELDYGDFTGATPIIYFRSKTHLLSVDSTGHFTLTDRPQGGGSATDAVLYTPQSLTDSQKTQARTNVGAGTYSKPSGGIPKSDLAQAVQDALDATSSGLTEEVKQALLDCFENVAWINDDGQTYYDALYAALYPPKTLVSISAVFTQGSAVIYDTDSLDMLKQYLTVTAIYDDTSTGAVTNYTLSGTLTVGTSTITVLYGGKTDTFTVTVTGNPYQLVEYVETDGASRIDTGVVFDGTKDIEVTLEMAFAGTLEMGESALNGWSAGGSVGVQLASGMQCWTDGASAPSASTHLSGIDIMTNVVMTIQSGSATNTVSVFSNTNGTKTLTRTHANVANRTFLPFPLFALSKQDSFDYLPSGFRIKSAIINVGGTVVRNMKACYRKSDNVIGFFDETNSVFYTNAGTGTFTKGGDIS